MSKANEDERFALLRAMAVVRYAAENNRAFDATIAGQITDAARANEDGKWDAAASKQFWAAYNSLATAVQPLSIESLSAVTPARTRRVIWLRWLGEYFHASLATRSA